MRHDFRTEDGREVGVLVHRDGRRDILVYDSDDPDTCSAQIPFSPDDTRTLSELLGVSQVAEAVGAVQQKVEGLSIEWITVDERSTAIGRSIAEREYRTRTGASIVAIVRDDSSIPAPSPEVVVESGDVVVAVGTIEGLAALRELIDAA